MDEISALDKHIINDVTEAVVVLQCLDSENLFEAETTARIEDRY
jgi:hypothetical protein